MQKQPLLEVKNLVTQFKMETEFVKAVNDISFTLHKGETIGIVGESGSGKSVTSLSVMQLIPNPPGKITGGEIIYHAKDGRRVDLVKTKKDEMRRYRGSEIAMIFQEPMTSLNPVMKCGEQVMEAILLHRAISKESARTKTLDLFKEVQLPSPELMFDRYPHQLSGGQKQRVMIAMAISCEPSVLIADEPTTALDVTVQKTILELMQKLQMQYQMGILFITHDLGVIAELADQVVVMYKGKIVEQGPVLEIFSNPKHPYTKSLLACRPPLDFRVKRLPVVGDFMRRGDDGEIIAIENNVTEALKSVIISNEERKALRTELYRRDKILELKNVKTWFPSKKTLLGKVLDYSKAVDDVSFDVYEGETLGLVGESGCGKTTLGRTILKLAEAVGGSILYRGKDILKMNEGDFRQYRRNMQLIFQDPYSSLNPRITIGNAIEEPMRVHGIFKTQSERKARVMELLKRVGLEEKHYQRYPHEFSGGQRQRICIARALGLNPEFIICDESVSALDVSVQAQVLNLLNELKQEFKFTYIFISHDLSVVKFMSDRMIVMQKGKIEEMGDPDEIYLNPKSEYTKKLIDSIPKGDIENIKESLRRKKKIHLLLPDMWEFLKQLTDPNSIIEYGGLWLLLFVIFAETGLLVGFFLPGDNLILLAGILCKAKPDLMHVGYFELVCLMALAAVLGNTTGYWFGRKAGEKLYARKDGWLFKQKQIEITKTYYDKYGGNLTLVMARFLPVVRTFAPIIAGVIKIDFFKFMFFNIAGAMAWILSLTGIGYFLVQVFPQITNYMGYIFIALIILTALPILRIVLKKKKAD